MADRERSASAAVRGFLLLLLLSAEPVAAANTDVIVLDNGDRITGEIKTLDQARLEVSTGAMSTVYIEWTHVVEVTSVTTLEVILGNGDRHIGKLAPATRGQIAIVSGSG